MFFLVKLSKSIRLHPKYFGAKLQETLTEALNAEVVGSCTSRYGYIVGVVKIVSLGKGKISESGFATFVIEYVAIVFKPFRNEVMDGVVSDVNKLGFFCYVGPLQIFISRHQISDPLRMKFDGEVPCFIVEQDSPEVDLQENEDEDEQLLQDDDQPSSSKVQEMVNHKRKKKKGGDQVSSQMIIKKDDEIRLKIMGTKVDGNALYSIGTIKEDFLGTMTIKETIALKTTTSQQQQRGLSDQDTLTTVYNPKLSGDNLGLLSSTSSNRRPMDATTSVQDDASQVEFAQDENELF